MITPGAVCVAFMAGSARTFLPDGSVATIYSFGKVAHCTCASYRDGGQGTYLPGQWVLLNWCQHLELLANTICTWVGPTAHATCPRCGGPAVTLPPYTRRRGRSVPVNEYGFTLTGYQPHKILGERTHCGRTVAYSRTLPERPGDLCRICAKLTDS